MSTTSALFTSLLGNWTLRRTLTSALPSFPSGTFTGTALFTSFKNNSNGLLYTESGTLTTSTGLTLKANKKYIYQYSLSSDKISAWFVKESRGDKHTNTNTSSEEEEEVDYLFHELAFDKEIDGDGVWNASGDHLCVKDDYCASYQFIISGGELKSWSLRYNVKGPAKDYVSDTTFSRS